LIAENVQKEVGTQMGQFRVMGTVLHMEVVQPVVVEHRSTPEKKLFMVDLRLSLWGDGEVAIT
jgi:hypothetical protein